MEITELILRITIGFVVLFVLTRIMGRKEISQMTFFNFVSAIAIGSIAANLVVSQTLSIRNGIFALAGWTVYTLVMDFIDIKSKNARKITTGDPIVVIKEGKIIEDALRKCRLNINSLNALLRSNKVFSITDVEFAVFETNGQLSVMKKESKQPATKSDMNIAEIPKFFPAATEVIADGILLTKNLAKLNITSEWVEQQIKQTGIESVSDVFYAEAQPDGTLYIDSRERGT